MKAWEFRWLRKVLRLRRRPDETQEKYNRRTANKICTWARGNNFKLMHQRALFAVFKGAWREHAIDSPLRRLRHFRVRDRWEGVKHEPACLRKGFDWVHSGMGPRTEWEDILVLAYGPGWRTVRDQCKCITEWMQRASTFVNIVCEHFKLPQVASKAKPEAPPAAKRARHVRASLDERPHAHRHAPATVSAYDWADVGCRFVLVVDCKPLQSVIMGSALLMQSQLHGCCGKIVDNLAALLEDGWRPPRDWHDPVVWHPRDQNIVADFLANYTMDVGESWSKALDWPFPGVPLPRCNIVAHSDGGLRRSSGVAASAWIVEVGMVDGGSWTYRPLAMGGTFVAAGLTSSFGAEAIALQECSLFLRKLIDHYGVQVPLGKKLRFSQ